MLDPRALPEIAKIKDASPETLRLEGTLSRRLPQMPTGELNDLHFTDSRQLEAEQAMMDMRAAFDISKQYDRRSKAVAKAKGRKAQKEAESGGKRAKVSMRKGQSRSKQMEKRAVRQFARHRLGMGTDLYK